MVELGFPAARGPRGVAIAARQTLLSTFLFYQTMAYVGRGSGELLAAIERGGPEAGRRALGMARVLGGIEVEVAEGRLRLAGDRELRRGGADRRRPARPAVRGHRARARCASGCASRAGTGGSTRSPSAELGTPVAPVRLEPVSVEREGRRDDDARKRIVDGERHLVTRPGDAYRLVFRLPPSARPLELFLESEGFYYEWMRAEWLAEEDPAMAALALASPAEALRRLAPAYKAQEGRLEQAFWASRFRK